MAHGTGAATTRPSSLLLPRGLPEGLALLARLTLLGKWLAATFAADTREFLETGLDIPLTVVRLVGNTLRQVVHVTGRVEIRSADLTELVKNLIPDLTPVLA